MDWKKVKEGMHLVNWKRIAKPKKTGGWGIKNIFSFGKALAAKILWRCLMVPRLWHEVAYKKYLKKKIVVDWFREGRKNWVGMSNCWRDLTSSLSIITDWLVWKPGNGWDIRIGEDPMIGSQSYYKLSKNLISILQAQGIKFLAQAGSIDIEDPSTLRWKKAETLGLEGGKKEEWDKYVKGLVGSGFELNVENDTLMWSWNTKGGHVNAKQAYEVQMMEDSEGCQLFWYIELWKWKIPFKVKLFMLVNV
jgi:hypothetical protein